MKKTGKFLIVCVAFIGIGISLFTTGAFLGGRVYGFSLNSRGFHVNAPGLSPSENIAYIEETVALDDFHSIEANTEFLSIRLRPGKDYSMSYRVNSLTDFTYEVTDGTLTITENYKNNHNYDLDFQWFSFGSLTNDSDLENEYLEIYVPQDTLLDAIALSSDFSDLFLKDIHAKNILLESEHSDIYLVNSSASSVTINSQHGEIDAEQLTGENLSLESAYGDVSMTDIKIEKDADFTLKNGSLELENASFYSLEVNSDFGDMEASGILCNSVDLSFKNGNCEMEKLTADTITITSAYGDIALELTAPVKDYNCDIRSEYGDIYLDGENIEDRLLRTSSDSSKQITAESKNGNIAIN